MLKIDKIDVYYGEVQILRQISLDIEKGKLVCLLGSNGAGKTTTVRSISGILPVRHGSIQFNGEEVNNIPAHSRVERGLIQIPEGRKIFPSLTVMENLEMGSYLRGAKSHRKESLERVMGMFPIMAERSQQAGGTLSGGEQQMLAIARGLMSMPKLLMLDEPSLGLAPIIVNDILNTVQEINRGGVTILLVEQNIFQALSISDWAFVLEQGRIALTDKAASMLTNPHIKKVYLE